MFSELEIDRADLKITGEILFKLLKLPISKLDVVLRTGNPAVMGAEF